MKHLEISGLVGRIVSIFVGIAVILWPKLIAYVIGAYLILTSTPPKVTVGEKAPHSSCTPSVYRIITKH